MRGKERAGGGTGRQAANASSSAAAEIVIHRAFFVGVWLAWWGAAVGGAAVGGEETVVYVDGGSGAETRAGAFERLARRQSGVVTTGQAMTALGRGVVRAHLTSGRWRRVCRGILSTTNGRLARGQQVWVAVLVAGRGAVLAGSTALTAAGVRGLRTERLYVLVPAARGRTIRLPSLPPEMPVVRIVRTRVLPGEHLHDGGLPRTTTARAAVDAAMWAPGPAAARTVLAMACQQRRVTPDEIFAVLAVRRNLPRARLIRATMLDISGGAQALSEIDFLALCRRFGLPAPHLQERRTDGAGRLRFLDAYWPAWRLHVEIDGAYHMEAGQWADDMLRQNDVWIHGDRILRFPAAFIRDRPARVAAQLLGALEAAGWRP